MSFSRTGLFDFAAKRIGDVSTDLFKKLKSAQTKLTLTGSPFNWKRVGHVMEDATIQIFADLDLPERIDPNNAWICPNENFCNVLVVTFNEESKMGLIVVENEGIWSVSGSTYSWRSVQDLDIVPSLRNDGSMQLDTLK